MAENKHTKEEYGAVIDALWTRLNKKFDGESGNAWDMGFFGSRRMQYGHDRVIKVPRGIKNITKVLKDARNENHPMTYEIACEKIHHIIENDELLTKDSAWNSFVKFIRKLLTAVGLAPSKEKREELDKEYLELDKIVTFVTPAS